MKQKPTKKCENGVQLRVDVEGQHDGDALAVRPIHFHHTCASFSWAST